MFEGCWSLYDLMLTEEQAEASMDKEWKRSNGQAVYPFDTQKPPFTNQ